MKNRFEIVKSEIEEMRSKGEMPYDQKEQKRKAIEDLYAKLKESYDTHSKELERLKKRLKDATSELEREQILKEMAELEKELAGMHSALEDLVEYMRDLDRRTVSQPQKDE